MGNYVVCVARLLLMFTISMHIGVLTEIVVAIMKHDVGPFLVILLMFIFSFEVAAHFFSWGLGQRQWGKNGGASWFRGFGSYFSVLGLDLDDYGELFDARQGLPEWDVPDSTTLAFQMMFSVAFFLLTVVILMNLLIAMMSDTFGRVTADAEAQWRTKFAGQVREYWDASLLPPPFNFVEHLANKIAEKRQQAKENHYSATLGNVRNALWGRHYVWPLPPAHFDLRLPHGGDEHLGLTKRSTLTANATLKDLRHVSARISEKIDAQSDQIERNFRSVEDAPRDHLVVEVVDPNAVITGSHLGFTMATELGVSQWWRPEPEHSRCFAGARGDVIGETVCSHGHQEKCTAACAVAVRLHPLSSDGGNLSRGVSAQASGGKRVILIRKIGVRVAAVPSGMMSRSFKEFSSPLQRAAEATATAGGGWGC